MPANMRIGKQRLALMRRVVDRAYPYMARTGLSKMDVLVSLVACDKNGCKLDLDAMLAADVANLLHDVGGIVRYLDQSTGKLTDCFVPRFAA